SDLAFLRFTGSAPLFAEKSLMDITANVYYPDGDASWEETVKQNYGGNIIWNPEKQYIKPGDINRDGKVNTIDANYARRYAAGLLTLDEAQKLAGDVNLDGEVNVMDSAIIRRYVVKYITSLPYLKEI
ncbi:MAG: dockerin type I repeat-containing protein, partial [Oscillospiraceae bacterium]|nr:dockerin type I repeat-containing protein [Oscillospiraceae bacterium]